MALVVLLHELSRLLQAFVEELYVGGTFNTARQTTSQKDPIGCKSIRHVVPRIQGVYIKIKLA